MLLTTQQLSTLDKPLEKLLCVIRADKPHGDKDREVRNVLDIYKQELDRLNGKLLEADRGKHCADFLGARRWKQQSELFEGVVDELFRFVGDSHTASQQRLNGETLRVAVSKYLIHRGLDVDPMADDGDHDDEERELPDGETRLMRPNYVQRHGKTLPLQRTPFLLTWEMANYESRMEKDVGIAVWRDEAKSKSSLAGAQQKANEVLGELKAGCKLTRSDGYVRWKKF